MQNSLSQAIKERKQLEQDAQLLANRIKLLQLEEEKAWKKILDTKKQVQKIATVKKDLVEKESFHRKIQTEKERALSEKQSNYKRMRNSSIKERQRLKSAIFLSKQEEASAIKNQRMLNLRSIHYAMEVARAENKKRKDFVKSEMEQGKERVLEFRRKKRSIGKEIYWQKVEDNDKIRYEKIKEVENMEKLEYELIKKLQNTQFIRNHAFKELESLMRSSRSRLDYSNL